MSSTIPMRHLSLTKDSTSMTVFSQAMTLQPESMTNPRGRYKKDANGIPEKDFTLQNPRCVFQLLKKHYSRYDLEKVSSITGTPVEDLKTVYEMYSSTGVKDRAGTVMYALGQTQHTTAVQNIRTLCMIQLLLGNIGICGGGVNAMRGEPNVQGSTDFAILSHYIPGYLPAPQASLKTLDEYLKRITPKSADPRSANWQQNYPKYMVSLLKAWYGDKADQRKRFRLFVGAEAR